MDLFSKIQMVTASDPVSSVIEWWLFKNPKTKRPELQDIYDKTNLPKVINVLAASVCNKNHMHIDAAQKEDLMMAAMDHTFTPDNIAKFDIANYSTPSGMISFFGGIFKLKMLTEVTQWSKQQMLEVHEKEDEDGPENKYENHGDDFAEDGHHHLEFKQLIVGLNKYFEKQKEGKYLVHMFPLLIQGASSREIAEDMGLSEPFVSKHLKLMKQYISEYATHTGNTLLGKLMGEYGGVKRHSITADDDAHNLMNVFNQYKHHGSMQASTPDFSVDRQVGDMASFQKSSIPSLDDESLMTKLSLYTPKGQVKALREEFESYLSGQEEVIEDPVANKLIGFRQLAVSRGPLKSG